MRVQPAWNRQTDSRNKTELRTQSARRAAAAQARQTGAKVCVKAAEKRRAGREQSGGTPQKKGRSLLGLHVKKQQKTCALCAQRTNDKQTPAAAQAGRKSGRRRVGRKTTPQKAGTIAASLTHGRQGCGREHTPGQRSHKPPQQRQAAQRRPPRQTARHTERRKTPPNRQNAHSLFCLPGGAM